MEIVKLSGADGELVATRWAGLDPVVLLHAGGERRTVWEPIGTMVAATTGRRVVAVDQRGHGESQEAGTTGSLEGFIADTAHVLTYVGTPAALVGASLGGFAALGAAARRPHEVSAVVLIDVVPNLDTRAARRYLATTAGGRFAGLDLVDDILGRIPEMCTWASRLSVPLLLVRGEHGNIAAPTVVELEGLCPQLIVVDIPDAGHLVAQDQPHRLAEILCWFFDGSPRGDGGRRSPTSHDGRPGSS